jgi:phosphoglycolate phosphatase-like HAD superfamily hydrolase
VLRVLLFDVDGTLIRTGKVVRAAFFRALEECFGFRPLLDGYGFGGKTDPQIVRELMAANGVPEARIRALEQVCLCRYLDLLEQTAPEGDRGSILPGVREILDRCRARGDALLGLLTGNLERGARWKLGSLGLWDCFGFGAFAEEGDRRDAIARVALERARAAAGTTLAPGQVTVVGDTEHDIDCARAIGARAVAVATGTRSLKTLRSHAPDVLLPDLSDLTAAEAALFG